MGRSSFIDDCPECGANPSEYHMDKCSRNPKNLGTAPWLASIPPVASTPALTGGSSAYYSIEVAKPCTVGREPYVAECQDLIEALNLNFAQGNAFKAIWRMGATALGRGKPGTSLLYDAEKVEFFGAREVARHTPTPTT